MPDRRKHRDIRLAVRKCAGLAEIDVFLGRVLANASSLFVLRQKWRQDTPPRNVVLELQPVADDFIDSEMQRDGPYLKIESAGHKHIAIAKLASGFNQRFGLTE